MTDFKCDAKIQLEYHFTDIEDYRRIKKLNIEKLPFKAAVFDIMGYFFDPTKKTSNLMKSNTKYLLQAAHLVEEVEKSRLFGRCKLITKSPNHLDPQHIDQKTTAVIVFSFDIHLICILPTDLLQYNINIANIKNDKLRESLSLAFPLLIKSTDLINQLIKKHPIFLEKLSKNSPLEELDIDFLIDLINFCNHYVDEIIPTFKYFRKIQKIKKSFDDQTLLESLNKQLGGNIGIQCNITTTHSS